MPVAKLPLEKFGLVSVETLAEMKDRDTRAVQRWIADGLLPAVVVGSGNRAVYLVPKRAAEKFQVPPRGAPKKGRGK